MRRIRRFLLRAGKPPAPPRIYLDPDEAAQAQRAQAYRYHVLQIPVLRLVGLSLLALLVLLHNRFLLPPFAGHNFLHLCAILAGYAALSWGLLYAWSRRLPASHLGLVFLVVDLVVFTVAIYFAGGAQSWLFFVLIARTADQAHTTFRNAVFFAHVSPLSYLLLLGYLQYVEHQTLVWTAEWTKVGFIYVSCLYLALTTKTAEGLRQRLTAAIRIARELIGQLAAQSTQLAEAKRTAEQLGRSNALILQTAGEGIYGVDLHGQITFVNPVAAHLLGWDVEDLRGQSMAVMLRRLPPEAPLSRFLQHVGSHPEVSPPATGPQAVPAVFCRKDGTDFPVEYISMPLIEADELRGLVVTFKDVTERVHAEAALRAARDDLERRVAERTAALSHANAVLHEQIAARHRMEEELLTVRKLESIGILAGGIAHDFNNLLTGILGNISLAKMLIAPPAPSLELLTAAEQACQRATALTHQLLTFARGGAPIRETMSFTALIHESVGFVGHGSNVRCTVSLPEDLWSVEADPGQMSQVIHNLLLNAQQAMPDGGTIALQGANLLLGEDADLPLPAGRYVTITIRDQGCGIPESHLAQIFDPYFTTKQSGSGLGLATTYAIMQKHDGYVHVASTLGVGTTFCLYLPASPGAVPPRPQGLDSPQAGQGCILLMDDEAMLRELGSAILTRLGYEVETAQDGAEALELYQRAQAAGQPFAAVILDLTIPGGMGGQEALTALLRLDPQVTAIVSSGYSQDPVMANCTAYGFRDVVTKPYTVQELSDTLQRVLRGGGRHAETEGKNAL